MKQIGGGSCRQPTYGGSIKSQKRQWTAEFSINSAE